MPSVVADEGRGIPPADFLEDRFDLTPAEARLVVHLVAGASLRSCAKALGIKYQTVRSYLKSAFRKTGTHRQSELVLTVFHAMSDSNPSAVPVTAAQAQGHAERKRYPQLGGYAEQKRHAQLRRA
jgi:DNA-binding CsgD family transcriptional regulator